MTTQEDALPTQALLLADSFATRFRPLTAEIPKVLMPLVNVPMLEYTLHFLASGGMQEIIVACSAHAETVRRYLDESPWLRGEVHKDVSVRVVSGNFAGVSDVLEALEDVLYPKRSFVLVTGDVVGNVPLRQLVRRHEDALKQDPTLAMTVVLSRAPAGHRARPRTDALCVAYTTDSASKLVAYDQVEHGTDKVARSVFPLSTWVMESGSDVRLRGDLMDAHMYICSDGVAQLFAGQIDWQHVDRHFIPGLLSSEVLREVNSLRAEVVSDEHYLRRVADLGTFDGVSRDVAARCAFPMTPLDNNLFEGFDYRRRHRGRIACYVEGDLHDTDTGVSGVVIASDALVRRGAVGKGTRIDRAAQLHDTFVGRRCHIHSGAKLRRAHVWDNVTVHTNAVVGKAILARDVVVGEGATIGDGCVLAPGVVVGRNAAVPPHTMLSLRRDAGYQESSEDYDLDVLGADGKGYVVRMEGCDFDVNCCSLEPEADALKAAEFAAPTDSFMMLLDALDDDMALSEEETEDETDEEEESVEDEHLDIHLDVLDPATWPSLQQEISKTLQRGEQQQLQASDVLLEVGMLKIAQDASLHHYFAGVFLALLRLAVPPASVQQFDYADDAIVDSDANEEDESDEEDDEVPRTVLLPLMRTFKKWHKAVQKFTKSVPSQVSAVDALAAVCVRHVFYRRLFVPLLKLCLSMQVLSAESMSRWLDDARDLLAGEVDEDLAASIPGVTAAARDVHLRARLRRLLTLLADEIEEEETDSEEDETSSDGEGSTDDDDDSE